MLTVISTIFIEHNSIEMKYTYVIGLMLFLGYAQAQVIDFYPYTESFESSTTLWSGVVDAVPSCNGDENPYTKRAGSAPNEGSGPLTANDGNYYIYTCLLYTSPRPRDRTRSRMPSSA